MERESINFICSITDPPQPFPHFWKHTVGSGHATLALRADWQKQLSLCHTELGFKHVRFHGVLSDDMDTLVNEDGKFVYFLLCVLCGLCGSNLSFFTNTESTERF